MREVAQKIFNEDSEPVKKEKKSFNIDGVAGGNASVLLERKIAVIKRYLYLNWLFIYFTFIYILNLNLFTF